MAVAAAGDAGAAAAKCQGGKVRKTADAREGGCQILRGKPGFGNLESFPPNSRSFRTRQPAVHAEDILRRSGVPRAMADQPWLQLQCFNGLGAVALARRGERRSLATRKVTSAINQTLCDCPSAILRPENSPQNSLPLARRRR